MTSTRQDELRIAEIPTDVTVDPVTLDIIEGALKNARFEMDAVLFRSAMSPVIREQHDEFPMITDPRGRMVVGQFGAYISEMMADWDRGVYPGDVILTSDPVQVLGVDLAHERLAGAPADLLRGRAGRLVEPVRPPDGRGRPASRVAAYRRPHGLRGGIIIPPVKIVERGAVQEDVLRVILNNVRLPEMNRADLFAIVAGCRAGERRVLDLCERFGKETYLAALQALLDRTYEAMRTLIQLAIPEEPQSFEDYIDDDGLGNGPFKMKLTIWREGDDAFFDWTGTDPQALGPINFYLSEGMFKMFIGIYLIMVNDPQILFNDGFYPLLHVVMPEGCLLKPRYPAALGCRTHALARQFDVLGGALCKLAPELNTAAGYGTSPYMLYSGWDGKGEFFYSMEILFGGIPGRPIGDGMDGHSWWPLFENIPTEYLEAYYPMRIDGYTTITDSGRAGLHRGGNGVEKRYVYLEPGHPHLRHGRDVHRRRALPERQPSIGRETAISHFRIRVPSVDVHTVGAGGGSIAHVPQLTKALRVGPESAGAAPGPAAYGRGGELPTVTDANVVLGHLPPQLLGGEMSLDVEAARTAVQTIADAMGLGSVEEAAEGILAIVNENMAGALRLVSVQRGHDPRDFALVAYGGAGPLHANAVARLMGSFPVLVPPAPGLLCAIGDLVADFRDEFAQTYIRLLSEAEPAEVAGCSTSSAAGPTSGSTSEGIAAEARTITHTADMRYHGQGYEIPVAIDPEEIRSVGVADLEERFNGLHEQLYGFRMHGTAPEIVNLRAVGFGSVPKPELAVGEPGGADASGAVVDEHQVWFEGAQHATTIYDRSKLRPQMRFEGPAIVTEFDSTTVVLPGYAAEVDVNFNILINPQLGGARWQPQTRTSSGSPRSRPASRSTRSRSTSSKAH